jgi:outer membrane protein OmpA-like peptidoglycan-associated protein
LAGQDLILKDYNITVFPSVVGKIVDFASDALNIQIPLSPIPAGAFGMWGSDDDSEAYKSLMDATGSGTKSLIYDAVSRNKYGPTLSDPVGRLANTFGGGQPPQLVTYISNISDTAEVNIREQEEKPLVDKINQSVGRFVDNLASSLGVGKESTDVSPYEFEQPSVSKDPILENANIGFDSLFNGSGIDTWATVGPIDKITLPDGRGGTFTIPTQGADAPIGTKIPFADGDWLDGAANNGKFNQGVSYDKGMYWGSHNVNSFKRGILKYTQELVNNAKPTKDKPNTSNARFIGVTNDPMNYDQKSGRHSKYSMGNTVASKDNTFYCRSWSVRNPYRKVSDLIRHGGNFSGTSSSLTRPDFNLSVLGSNGFVKIAPYVSDPKNGFDGTVLKLGNPTVQKYMFSIENLAWQNSEHLLKIPSCEVGPNGGRIMWFPPYDINFTDNSSVNWDSTTFIGRGEPIYTYNSTERTGTLAFKIIVDHSMALTEIKNKGDEALFRYFAGCDDPIEEARNLVPPQTYQDIVTEWEEKEKLPQKDPEPEIEIKTPVSPPTTQVQFYFRNARYFELDTVGTNLTKELSPNANEQPPNYKKGYTRNWPNGYLCGSVPTETPTILDPTTNEIVPNPAFSGTIASDYSINALYSLNQLAQEELDQLIDFLLTPDGKRYRIKIVGKTSDAGPKSGKKSNQQLGEKRAESTKDYILKKLTESEVAVGAIKAENLGSQDTFPTETEWKDSDLRWSISTTGEEGANLSISTDTANGSKSTFLDDNRVFGDSDATVPEAIRNRTTVITLEYNPEIDSLFKGPAAVPPTDEWITTTKSKTERQYFSEEQVKQDALLKELTARASQYMAWECSYFEEMKQNDSFIYETLQEKLKYFHPAFHSMTPEGFNARLTFLKQCTRQGPNVKSNEPSNMAFGKPPICVLRIGDFYHTKIVIDSVNLTFDPLQWDLNPEGIGVQPMLCNVDISFKFIGGSSLGGPISELQNAVGFNFFANTGLYNPRVISKSVKEYTAQKPDPITGQLTDIAVKTINEGTETFAFGAYITPGMSYDLTGGLASNTSTPPANKAEQTTQLQQSQEQISPKDATPDESLTKTINESFNTESTTTETSTTTDVVSSATTITDQSINNVTATENKVMKGFDSEKGIYITQHGQTLTWKGLSSNESQTWKTLKIPSGTKVYINKDTDGTRVVFIGKVINPGNNKPFFNKVLLNCNDFGKGLHFTVKPVDGLQENPSGIGAFYTNSTLYNVIKPIFCKGNVPKTWKELTQTN